MVKKYEIKLHRTASGLFEGFNTEKTSRKKIPVMSIAGFFFFQLFPGLSFENSKQFFTEEVIIYRK